MANIIEMKNIVKTFCNGEVIANDKVDFSVREGEVHAILGENGAGKTTLMNVLYGMYKQDSGEILIKGEKINIDTPLDAMENGLGMIHQHFKLVEVFNVVENISIGLEGLKPTNLEKAKIADKILALSTEYGLPIDPWEKVENLSVGLKQRTEIIKVLYRGANILIMDEPTAVLTPNEVKELFVVLKDFVKNGGTVIYISHKLKEVMEISDRVTIMRNGKSEGTYDTNSKTTLEFANLMVGRDVILQYDKEVVDSDEEVLRIKDLSMTTDKKASSLKHINFVINKGEILGIAGVDGNGQKELEESIAGLMKNDGGKIMINGQDISGKSISERIEAGLGYVPEDRMTTGLIQNFSVKLNLILKSFNKAPFVSKNWNLVVDQMNSTAENLVKDFGIKIHNIDQDVSKLSGGNQQKVAVAREMYRNPEILVVSQPTRGLDVGAIEAIHKKIIAASRKGMAVLLISSDLDEVLEVSDRVMVMYEGEIKGEFMPKEIPIDEIGLMMAGLNKGRSDA
jgi:simple sugar transport system ATP-binding protein